MSSRNKIQFRIEDVLVAKTTSCDMTNAGPVVGLLNFIALQYFTSCLTIILYDEFFYKSITFQPVIMMLLKTFPGAMIHGQFSSLEGSSFTNVSALLQPREVICRNFIVLSQTLESSAELLGYQANSKVVLVSQASKWQINNFLESPVADQFMNLLVLADPTLHIDLFERNKGLQMDINLYTHKLYADPMGARVPWLLTAWRCDRLTRPNVNLFPPKMKNLNGYQLRVVADQRPPYVYQKYNQDSEGDTVSQWDGLEVRLLHLISTQLNLTLKFQQPTKTSMVNPFEGLLGDLKEHKADLGTAGVYLGVDRLVHFRFSTVHSQDCSVFMTLASTALPKYRAIMGPFRWEVWMAITLAYLLAIIPISFSAHHTLRPLMDNPSEIENMFWYVFGTFTNCFTFTGKQSWTSDKKYSTRLFIGTYWAFSIIVSAAYTGSIIAFIMLPQFPEVIQTIDQLVENDYRLITTNNTDLKRSIYNTSDPTVLRLAKRAKIVESVEEAVTAVIDSPFFTDYAFLHSREFLKHIIKTNSSTKRTHKKSVFHLTENCFVPMLVAIVFPPKSILAERFDSLIMQTSQAGLLNKLLLDVAWDQQKLDSGKLLQVSGSSRKHQTPDERQLTLDDTQGMFLLMATGFTMALISFLWECLVPAVKRQKKNKIQLPSIELLGDEGSLEGGNFQFRTRSDFLEVFGSSQEHVNNKLSLSLVVERVQVPIEKARTLSI